MTTGRINQVACRAARDAPIPGPKKRARPAAPPTERRSAAKHARSDAPNSMGASPHARLAPDRAGCSTCVRSVLNGLGSHARPLPRESSRARRRNQRRRAPRERSAAGRRTESPLRPAEHPLATLGAQHTETHATPDRRAPHWQGSEPEQRGRRASIQFSKARSRLRPRGGPCCAGPSAPQPNGGSRRGRPLHALACTRRLRTVAKPFTQFQEMPWHARARLQFFNWNRPRTAAASSEAQGHALPRAPSLLLSPRHIGRAGGRPRPLWVPAVARASRRARSTGLPRICRRRLPRARALQPCNRLRLHRPQQRRPSERVLTRAAACLWSPRCALRKKSPSAHGTTFVFCKSNSLNKE